LNLSESAIPVANIATGGAAGCRRKRRRRRRRNCAIASKMTSNCLLLWRFLHNFNTPIGR
jgi:hypothetical protein